VVSKQLRRADCSQESTGDLLLTQKPEPYRGVAIMTSALISELWVPLKAPLTA